MKDRSIVIVVTLTIIFIIFSNVLRFLKFNTQLLGISIFIGLMLVLLFFNWKTKQGNIIDRMIITAIIIISIAILSINLLSNTSAEFVMPILCIFGPSALINREKYLSMKYYVEFTYILFSMLIVATSLINEQIGFNFVTFLTGINVILSIFLMTYILIRFKKNTKS